MWIASNYKKENQPINLNYVATIVKRTDMPSVQFKLNCGSIITWEMKDWAMSDFVIDSIKDLVKFKFI